MRKILTSLLILLLFCGCEKKTLDTCYVAVASNEEINMGLVLLLDENKKIIEEIEVDYPYNSYLQENQIFVTNDEKHYRPINIVTSKVGETLLCKKGRPLLLDSQGCISYHNSYVYINDGSKEVMITGIVNSCVRKDEYIYLSDTNLNIYILKDFKIIETRKMNTSKFNIFTKFDDTIYLVQDKGICQVDKQEFKAIYPKTSSIEIEKVDGRYIYASENGENVVYEIKNIDNKIELEFVSDNNFYDGIDINDLFKEYYQRGYEIQNFYFYKK